MVRSFILCVVAAASLGAQGNPFYGPAPLALVREYLQLTQAQVTAMENAIREYHEWVAGKQNRILEVQVDAARETAKSPLDPTAIGLRYAEIEVICREVAARAGELQQANLARLTDAQKTRLRALEEAFRLVPVIMEAQGSQLMNGPALSLVNVPQFLRTGDVFSRTDGTRLGAVVPYVAGCSQVTVARWFDTSTFQSATPAR